MPEQSLRDIPVKRESRSAEEKHKEMVSSMRGRGRTPAHEQQLARPSNWMDDMNTWANWVDNMWNNEMRRIHDYALPLVPLDMFGQSPQDMFTPFGDFGSIMDRMNRQTEAIRRMMDKPMAGMHGGELMPFKEHKPLDYLKDAYEMGEDGRVHFKLRFNLKDYSPEDIKVKTSQNGISVHAKKTGQTDKGSFSREFSRTLYVPDSVDKEHFQSHLSRDGILTVEAPVIPERQQAITLGRDSQLGIKPVGEPAEKSLALQPLNKPGLSIVPNGDKGQKLHLEMTVEPDFTADNVCVRVDGNRVVVTGKKEVVDETPNSWNSHVKEFTRSYEIPETADTLAVNAQMHGNKLVVEAPLLPAQSKQ